MGLPVSLPETVHLREALIAAERELVFYELRIKELEKQLSGAPKPGLVATVRRWFS